MSGKLITFEGIDGAGKSSHLQSAFELISGAGKEVIRTREPGGTELGEKLRGMLLHDKMHVETEALLMFAARREHLAQVIEPSLSRNAWVLCDRFTDSSFAYQCGGRGVQTEKLRALEEWVHPALQPHRTILFDVSESIAEERLAASRELDRFEQEKAAFFAAVRNAYLLRAAEYPDRFTIVDSSQSIENIRLAVLEVIENELVNA